MNGLEYVLKLYDITQQELADKLGIKQQNIDLWIRDKNRKIPKKHLPKLENIFKQPEEVFQKELTDVEQIVIQQRKIRNELVEYEYENTFTDEESGEKVTIIETQPDQEQLYENNFLEFKKNIIKLHNNIDTTISSEFRNGVIDNDINLNADLFEAEELLEIYERFVGVIKRGNISKDTIKKVLKGMRHYEGKSFSGEKDILAVSGLVKQIEENIKR